MTSRAEVAKKLHSNFACGLGITPGSIAYALGYTAPKEATYDDAIRELFNCLADLIDPTCEIMAVPDNDEFMVRVVSGFMCKKCGHEAIVERNCDGWAEPPNYCPNCGARVVRDDG